MSVKIFSTLKNYKKEYLPKDILSGIIMAAVSIPISMGYAQIAGVPAVYGLYGSVLPILLFAMLSTSKQFIFGVDAAPAAIVGAALATLGVTAESAQALQYVPLIALFTGLWLFLFYLLHADKIVDFISTPVMGGFISGIAVTIIMMQIPKLMGSPAGNWRIHRTCRTHFSGNHKDKLVVLWNGNWSTCNLDCIQKTDSKVPDGNRYYDCRSSLDNCLSCKPVWCSSPAGSSTRASAAYFSGFYRDQSYPGCWEEHLWLLL